MAVVTQDWGDPSFRDAFRHIALVHARMPRDTVLIGLTATLLAGQETTELLQTLGLTPGTFFFQHRSNIRHDICDIYRVLRHGLSAWSFPDLDWVIEGHRKTLIYSGSFNLGFRIHTYFRHKAPQKIIRLYNSLSFITYNLSTRHLFINDPNVQIIIATDSLVVGMDFPNVEDVIDLDCHHLNHGKLPSFPARSILQYYLSAFEHIIHQVLHTSSSQVSVHQVPDMRVLNTGSEFYY